MRREIRMAILVAVAYAAASLPGGGGGRGPDVPPALTDVAPVSGETGAIIQSAPATVEKSQLVVPYTLAGFLCSLGHGCVCGDNCKEENDGLVIDRSGGNYRSGHSDRPVHTETLTPTPYEAATVTAASDGELHELFQSAPAALENSQREDEIAAILRDTPLEIWSHAMLLTSDLYGIDYRLLPVIAMLESTGGFYSCRANAWGYASCRVEFETYGEAMSVVASTLSKPPYAGLDFDGKLCMWVAGTSCVGEHAEGYRDRAHAILRERLGVD